MTSVSARLLARGRATATCPYDWGLNIGGEPLPGDSCTRELGEVWRVGGEEFVAEALGDRHRVDPGMCEDRLDDEVAVAGEGRVDGEFLPGEERLGQPRESSWEFSHGE